jgi:glyoxylase-like metal-dependent hydrolase (beta-lactamase superfamily II)
MLPAGLDPALSIGTMKFENISNGLWLFRDSCNVYALEGPAGDLIVNAGTGRWLEHLDELPAGVAAVACTHYFRDHSAGARAAADQGIPVFVPEGERDFFEEPEEHFRRRETYMYIIYDNLWNLFAPIEGIPVAGVLRDYDRVSFAGLELEVVPLPGATITQAGLAVELPGGEGKAIFLRGGDPLSRSGPPGRPVPV